MYEYAATVVRVVDGDTIDARLDLGFDISFETRFRLTGINAPEMHTPAGPPARDHLVSLLAKTTVLTVRTEKDHTEKYGRYLGTFITPDGVDLNAQMVADGFAKPWDGKGTPPV